MTASSNSFDKGDTLLLQESPSNAPTMTPDDPHDDLSRPSLFQRKMYATSAIDTSSSAHDNSQKINSTSAIDTSSSSRNSPTHFHDEKVSEMIHSFSSMKQDGKSYFLETDIHKASSMKKKLVDSHTSYRRGLEKEIAMMKLQLAEAQERADTLQNNFNRVSLDSAVYQAKMDELIEKYDNTKKHSEELVAVVGHLQENAKEAAEGRKMLQGQVDRLHRENKSLVQKNKILRRENRDFKKELKQTGYDLEGRGMENQGLKSENDWLKKQLSRNRGIGLDEVKRNRDIGLDEVADDVSALGNSSTTSSSESEPVVTGIRELLSFPSIASRTPPNKQRRYYRKKSISNLNNDLEERSAIKREIYRDDSISESGYTSFSDVQINHAASDDKNDINRDRPRRFTQRNSFVRSISGNPVDNENTGLQRYDMPAWLKGLGKSTSSRLGDEAPRNSMTAIQHHHSGLSAPSTPSRRRLTSKEDKSKPDNQQLQSPKWNWWSSFTSGEKQKDNDLHEEQKESSDYSSEDFVQYPPKPTKLQSSLTNMSPMTFSANSSMATKVLVPKSFGAL